MKQQAVCARAPRRAWARSDGAGSAGTSADGERPTSRLFAGLVPLALAPEPHHQNDGTKVSAPRGAITGDGDEDGVSNSLPTRS